MRTKRMAGIVLRMFLGITTCGLAVLASSAKAELIGTHEISYIYNSIAGGGANGSGNPEGTLTYDGILTKAIEIELAPGKYAAKIVHGKEQGNPASSKYAYFEKYWSLVQANNPNAISPETGYDGGNVHPDNAPSNWGYMASLWVGRSTAVSDGQLMKVRGLENATNFIVAENERVWLYSGDWAIMDNFGGVTVEIWKIPPTPADVWIQDTLPDDGIEPNQNPLGMWMSQAIWIRNNDDRVATHQNPRAGVMNSVYVNVRNRGELPSQPEGKVKIYWAYASTGGSWPGQWHEIGAVALPSIAPNNAETFTARLAWTPPMPGHYCLLVRLESQNDPMTVTETANVHANTRNNNNIAWRNMNVVGPSCEAAKLLIQNVPCGGGGYADAVDLVFDGSPDLFANSDVTVVMDLGEMFVKWQLAGGKGEAIRVLQGTTTVQLLSPQSTISGIPMEPEEQQKLGFRINVPLKFEKTGSYHLNIKQRVCGQIIGGVDYDVTPCLTEAESVPPTPTAIPSVSPTPTEPPFVTPVPTNIPGEIPEPATLMLFGIGLFGGGILLRKRMKK